MAENGKTINLHNPHDKLFRETWSNLENVRSFLKHYLPADVLKLMDLQSLEISKDSFVEKELADYFSDMLYKVTLSGSPGYVYVLFEHKSYYDKYVHLQLLEYMVKIWRLFLKQQKKKKKKAALPIVLPLLICHGDQDWPKKRVPFSSLLSGPVDDLSAYIPDFNFVLYDLSTFSDDDIKGTVMARVVMLLFKHIFDSDLLEKLPGTLSLMGDLMAKETGLQYLETVLRYLFSTVDDVSTETLKEIVEQALSHREGDNIMTLAEKLRMEGRLEGEIKGEIKGLIQAIELGVSLRFPDKLPVIMTKINKINDSALLQKIIDAIKITKSDTDIMVFLN